MNVTGFLTINAGSPAVGLYAPATITLNNPAVSPASLTLTSSNPAQLLLSATPGGAGSASITLTNVTGSSVTFYEQGVAVGSPTLTLTSSSYNTASAGVTVRQPGISFQTPTPMSTLAVTAGSTQFYASLGTISGGSFVPCLSVVTGISTCGLISGNTATVALTSSNTAAGTVNLSTLTFSSAVANIAVNFTPVAAGFTM